jgi:hypothetical protein
MRYITVTIPDAPALFLRPLPQPELILRFYL